MSVPQPEHPSNNPLDENVRRAAGIHALKAIRGIIDEDKREEAARTRLLSAILRYGWIVLLAGVGLLSHFFGVI
jgi:hypothetical protein